MSITYAWSSPTNDPERPVRGFVIGSGSATTDLPTQLAGKAVVDIMAGGSQVLFAGTGSIATDRATGTNYRLESDGVWH